VPENGVQARQGYIDVDADPEVRDQIHSRTSVESRN